jgi:hypothetical protein
VAREQRADLLDPPCASTRPRWRSDDLARQELDLVEHVARDEEVDALARELEEQLDDVRLATGSRPASGSSAITSFGSWTIAWAIFVRCRMPREYSAVRRPMTSPSPTRSSAEPARARASRAENPESRARNATNVEPAHLAVHRVLLRAESDLREVRAVRERVAAQHLDPSARRTDLAGDELLERRLAGAVRPEEPEDPALERHGDVDEADDRSVPAREVARDDHRLKRPPPAPHLRRSRTVQERTVTSPIPTKDQVGSRLPEDAESNIHAATYRNSPWRLSWSQAGSRFRPVSSTDTAPVIMNPRSSR